MEPTTEAAGLPPLIPLTPTKFARRNAMTLKLLFIAGLVLLLQAPLFLVNNLRQERAANHAGGADQAAIELLGDAPAYEGYRMVERSLKHSALVLTLVFAAYFLFEAVANLRLHAVHYGLVGAALCLFYLALLALGEFLAPGWAYAGAAIASSLLITLYSVAILRSGQRAAIIAGFLTAVHTVLFVILRMENFALLAGTTALFVALAAVMFFTRNVDWYGDETATPATR